MRNTSLVDALFSRTVQGILVAVIVEREEPWYMSDLAKRLKRTPSTLQRPLDSLVASGILTKTTDGNRAYYARNADCPILPELRGLLLKTVGLVDVLRAELKSVSKRLLSAFVYGSVARAEETSGSDVDLFLIGDVTLLELTPILKKMEARLARAVNVTLFPLVEYQEKLSRQNHFLRSVLAKEKLFVIGTEHDLEGLSKEGSRSRPQDKQGGDRRSARRSRAKS